MDKKQIDTIYVNVMYKIINEIFWYMYRHTIWVYFCNVQGSALWHPRNERTSIVREYKIVVSIMAVAFRFESVPSDVSHKDINLNNHSVDVYY